ncbi:hypothetical protein [Methylorubrum podarium]|uniref:hypothetical protein n=1 Tax=Methylorubrum podarium TaxID=200476 RepID=UPI001EE37A3F|nr:hypothetical protein [Methylorubrum podarium]
MVNKTLTAGSARGETPPRETAMQSRHAKPQREKARHAAGLLLDGAGGPLKDRRDLGS